MLLNQEAGDLVGVASLGSATDRIDRLDMSTWGHYLLPIKHILAVYDLDNGGISGSNALKDFSDRIICITLPKIPGVKDITDLSNAGYDLGNWICRTVEKLDLLAKDFP